MLLHTLLGAESQGPGGKVPSMARDLRKEPVRSHSQTSQPAAKSASAVMTSVTECLHPCPGEGQRDSLEGCSLWEAKCERRHLPGWAHWPYSPREETSLEGTAEQAAGPCQQLPEAVAPAEPKQRGLPTESGLALGRVPGPPSSQGAKGLLWGVDPAGRGWLHPRLLNPPHPLPS